ncbi:MAG: polyprenyl synthetase family protein [Deltaproteobacteria bacterium]|nr:polyprenyl synthetase family protein [Deltaproteobacteria bacterium]MBW2071713.1 polyprenyl synthetase family protein [Deltaproteobacteria bacterium]
MKNEFELAAYLRLRREMVDEALERFLPPLETIEARVVEAMRYSLFAKGKRLRPILCLAAAEAVGGLAENALPVACALEMIHTYSLIHDDLPAMDDDELRRGIPTSHKVFGEAMAILAGDALLTEAFHLLSRVDTMPSSTAVRIIEVIAAAASYRGMVGGQAVDMLWQNTTADIELVRYLHRKKTAALIGASLETGAMVGGGSEEQIGALKRYGHAIGLAFQIVDDVLDIEGDPAVLGKRTGVDVARGKATYPALLGLEQSQVEAEEKVADALAALHGFDDRVKPLRAIARYILTRKR